MFLEKLNLKESPQYYESGDSPYNNLKFNEEKTQKVLKDGEYLEDLNYSGGIVKIYLIKNYNEYSYFLIKMDKPIIVGVYECNKMENYIENKYIWNLSWCRGLIREFLDKYILPRWNIISSDALLSKAGFEYWKRIFDKYVNVDKTHILKAYNDETGKYTKISSLKSMDKYFADDDKDNYRFLLIKL